MKYRFIANLLSILVAVTAVSTPSSTNERYCASRISQDQAGFVLSVNIPLH
ncbi:MAG: hypothetical protein WCP16_26495 [Pseudanabaena sp. ELA645]